MFLQFLVSTKTCAIGCVCMLMNYVRKMVVNTLTEVLLSILLEYSNISDVRGIPVRLADPSNTVF